MKSMTCRELGGACDLVFSAETFAEIAQQSQQHGREMMQKGDQDHLDAMQKMMKINKDPSDMAKWMSDKEETFRSRVED